MDVLVLCRANVARSPLAAAILAAALPEVEVSSAGVRARDGDPAAKGSQQLAADRGLDLATHRSRYVTPELVGSSDLVLAMSEAIRDLATPLAPGAARKVFTLRELVRLSGEVDLSTGPATTPERLAWLRDAAHGARPAARRATGPEDVDDPIGQPWERWVALGATLDDLLGRVVAVARPR